jgi:acyl-CoA thioesterase-1
MIQWTRRQPPLSQIAIGLCLLCYSHLTWATPPVLLVLGDSLSAAHGLALEQGWVALLQQRLTEHWPTPIQVVNASVSGETTAGGVTRLPALLARYQPRWVIIELGANDGLRGLAPSQMSQHLQQLVTLSQAADAQVLMISVRMPPNYGTAYARQFSTVFRDLATQLQIAWVPQLLAGVADDWDLMQADGLHPTAAAQPLMLENVWPQLVPLLQQGDQ